MSSKTKKKLKKLKKPDRELTADEQKEQMNLAEEQMMKYEDKPSRIQRIKAYLQRSPIGLTIGTVHTKDEERDEYLKDLVGK